jgi:hypothetical protein
VSGGVGAGRSGVTALAGAAVTAAKSNASRSKSTVFFMLSPPTPGSQRVWRLIGMVRIA